jgi:hypothetical protein
MARNIYLKMVENIRLKNSNLAVRDTSMLAVNSSQHRYICGGSTNEYLC